MSQASKNGSNPPGKRGAPKGNRNALRHGLKGGQCPPGAEYIENRVNVLRRNLENAVLDAKGSIGIVDATAVNSALKWERHGLLAQHWLRKQSETLTPTECLKFSEAVAKASDARDKAIRQLNLDRDDNDRIINALYTVK